METQKLTTEELINKAKDLLEKEYAISIAEFTLKMYNLFKDLKNLHPEVEKICFGMGSWYMTGRVYGHYNDNQEELTYQDNLYFLKEYMLEKGEGFSFNTPFNDSMYELATLCEYFVDWKEGLNASTLIDFIDQDGIGFEREENPSSVFGYPPLSALLNSQLYKTLVDFNIPTKVIKV